MVLRLAFVSNESNTDAILQRLWQCDFPRSGEQDIRRWLGQLGARSARTFSLPPPWCVSRSFPLPASLAPVLGPSSFSPVGSCEREGGLGRVGLLGN